MQAEDKFFRFLQIPYCCMYWNDNSFWTSTASIL